MIQIADPGKENYHAISMLAPETTHDHRSCKVRGCPILLPEDTFVEWGTKDFLMASCSDPTTIPQHEHFPLQVSLPVSGSWMHTLGAKRSIVVSPGQALFIPSGETHGTRWVEPG